MPNCKDCPECRSCFSVPEKGLIVTECTGERRVISTPCHRAGKGCERRSITIEVLDPDSGLWFPSPEMPKEHRFGFCRNECFMVFIEQLFALCALKPKEERSHHKNGGERRDRNGFKVLDGGKVNERRRDGRVAMKGYNNGR